MEVFCLLPSYTPQFRLKVSRGSLPLSHSPYDDHSASPLLRAAAAVELPSHFTMHLIGAWEAPPPANIYIAGTAGGRDNENRRLKDRVGEQVLHPGPPLVAGKCTRGIARESAANATHYDGTSEL